MAQPAEARSPRAWLQMISAASAAVSQSPQLLARSTESARWSHGHEGTQDTPSASVMPDPALGSALAGNVRRGLMLGKWPAAIRLWPEAGNVEGFDREVEALMQADHANVVLLRGVAHTESGHMCVATELADASLEAFLYPDTCAPPPPTAEDLAMLGSSASLLPGPVFLATAAGSSAMAPKPAPLPLSSILSIGIHIAQGLAYLHAAKIAHGNLKPSNILLVAQRNDLEASPTAAPAPPQQHQQPGGRNGPTGSTQAFSQAIHKRLVAEMDTAQGPVAASRMLVLQAASLGDELFTVKLSDFRSSRFLTSEQGSVASSGSSPQASQAGREAGGSGSGNGSGSAALPHPPHPAYAAPEVQAAGPGNASPHSDMYSFGVVMWELLSRRPPWLSTDPLPAPASSNGHGAQKPCTWEPYAGRSFQPSSLLSSLQANAACPPALAALIERCLSADPAQRPGAGEVVINLALQLLDCEGRARARSKQSSVREAAMAARAMVHAVLLRSDAPLGVYGIPLLQDDSASLLVQAPPLPPVALTLAAEGAVGQPQRALRQSPSELSTAARGSVRTALLGPVMSTRSGTTIRRVRRWLLGVGGQQGGVRQVVSAP